MDCRDIRRHLYDFLDGALPQGAGEDFSRHLEQCPGCTDLVKGEERMKAWLADAADRPLAASLAPVRPESPFFRTPRWRPLLRPFAFATLLLVSLSLLLVVGPVGLGRFAGGCWRSQSVYAQYIPSSTIVVEDEAGEVSDIVINHGEQSEQRVIQITIDYRYQ